MVQNAQSKVGATARPHGRLRLAAIVLFAVSVSVVEGIGGEASAAPELTAAPWTEAMPGWARLPVLLVPGWSDGPEELEPLRNRFLRAGWPAGEVMAVEFDDPVGSNLDHADEIAAALDSLKRRTGSAEVDVVAHSMGGLATRWYLKDAGAESIRRVVFLATPHRGTLLSWATITPGGARCGPGVSFCWI